MIMLRLLRPFFVDNHISDAAAKSWARYFWLTALLAQICGTVTFPCKKRVLVEGEVMTTAQVQCIEGYHNNKSFNFFASILYALKICIDDVASYQEPAKMV